ncbi:MAG: hypothetical protein NVS3B27_11640 [Novosphingobium sp.]
MTVRLKLLAATLPALLAGCQQAVSAPAATLSAGADPRHPAGGGQVQSPGG